MGGSFYVGGSVSLSMRELGWFLCLMGILYIFLFNLERERESKLEEEVGVVCVCVCVNLFRSFTWLEENDS